MGFFDFLDRMAKGEPLYQDNSKHAEEPKQPDPPAEEATGPVIRKFVDSSFPVVHIKRVKTHENGNRMQVYCLIANTWPEEVELDKIRIFDTKHELDTSLRGNGERDYLVYDGPPLTREYHEVQLDYKTHKEGDYFRTIHDATYAYRPESKTYTLTSVHVHGPVHDIYEL